MNAAGLRYVSLKWLASLVSYLSGIPGGVFAPSLSIGAAIGAAFSELGFHSSLGAFSLLGMASYFAGVVQAPLTASVIVVEMTGDIAFSVPILLAALLGRAVSGVLNKKPLYAALPSRLVYGSALQHTLAESEMG
jgi:H+/Cl- antiporter ClcA